MLFISKQKGESQLLVVILVFIISAIFMKWVGSQGVASIEKTKLNGSVEEIIYFRNSIVRESHNDYNFSHVTNDYINQRNLKLDNWKYDPVNDIFVDSNNLFITVTNNIPLAFVPGTTGTSNDVTVNDGFTITISNIKKVNALSMLNELSGVFWAIRSKGNGATEVIFKNADGELNLSIITGWLDSLQQAQHGTIGLELITL
ncbi:MAG: hypothetical protein QM504_03315 [Pseudomonadota bacterium]